MEYLTRWSMMLAGDKLENSDDAVSSIALTLGYESESAFGKAFKKVMGCSPRQCSCSNRGVLYHWSIYMLIVRLRPGATGVID